VAIQLKYAPEFVLFFVYPVSGARTQDKLQYDLSPCTTSCIPPSDASHWSLPLLSVFTGKMGNVISTQLCPSTYERWFRHC